MQGGGNSNTQIEHTQCDLSNLKVIIVAVIVYVFNTFERQV